MHDTIILTSVNYVIIVYHSRQNMHNKSLELITRRHLPPLRQHRIGDPGEAGDVGASHVVSRYTIG